MKNLNKFTKFACVIYFICIILSIISGVVHGLDGELYRCIDNFLMAAMWAVIMEQTITIEKLTKEKTK